jgi:hypothetical protein
VHDWFSFPLGCLVVCLLAVTLKATVLLRYYRRAHYSFTKEKIPERFRKMKTTSFRSAWFGNTG